MFLPFVTRTWQGPGNLEAPHPRITSWPPHFALPPKEIKLFAKKKKAQVFVSVLFFYPLLNSATFLLAHTPSLVLHSTHRVNTAGKDAFSLRPLAGLVI